MSLATTEGIDGSEAVRELEKIESLMNSESEEVRGAVEGWSACTVGGVRVQLIEIAEHLCMRAGLCEEVVGLQPRTLV